MSEWKDPRKELPKEDCDVEMKVEIDYSFYDGKKIVNQEKGTEKIEGYYLKDIQQFEFTSVMMGADFTEYEGHEANDDDYFIFSENGGRLLFWKKFNKPIKKE